MRLTRAQLIIIGAVILLIIGVVLIFVFGRRSGTAGQLSGTINFWGIEDPSIMRELISGYTNMRPNVQVRYTRIDPNTYENELVNALAGADGPDLFMVNNTWLPKHFSKIAPLVNEEFTITDFRASFPTVVEQDFAPDGVIYALPLYLDTLALLYNKDIFDERGIVITPKNWSEFQALIPRLRELDRSGKIIKAAAAIGGSNKSIADATDVLNLLMLQSGVEMVSEDFTRATFGVDGEQPLKFYTQFANPLSPYFTWSDDLQYSLDSFSQGKTAMIFGYAGQMPIIKAKNPFLRIGVLPMLQPSNTTFSINYANYWGMAVSAKSRKILLSWDFINYLSTNSNAQTKYLELTQRPPAFRPFINQMLNDVKFGVFAQQALTARSWPQIDGPAIKELFSSMIENVVSNRLSAQRAIRETEDKVNQLMKKGLR